MNARKVIELVVIGVATVITGLISQKWEDEKLDKKIQEAIKNTKVEEL